MSLEFGGNLTISGSGSINPYRVRPVTGLSNVSVIFDAPTTPVTYGTVGMLSDNGTNDNVTITVNAGKTVNVLGSMSATGSSTGVGGGNVTLNVYGTLNVTNNFNNTVTSGKTYALTVYNGGLLSVGKFNLSAAHQLTASTSTVNAGGELRVTGAGTALDCSHTSITSYITGGGTFTTSAGSTVLLGNASGLDASTGPIRTATRNFNAGSNYSFVGTAAQVTGSEMPSTVNTLTINNAAGVTLSNSATVNGTITLTAGALATGANTLALKGAISGIGTITTGASGTLTFAGSAVQTLDGANITSNAINNLVVEGGSRLTTSGTIAATNLTINSSNLRVAGTLLGTLTATNASVNQYLGDARNWYITSPVSNAKAPAGYTYYQRDEVGASWTTQPFSATNDFIAGKGYIAMPGSTGSTLTFATETGGSLNTGNVTVALTKGSTTTAIGYNLIGNPYPSHLAWTSAFVDDVTNATIIDPTIWIRTNSGSSNTGGWSFLTYNGHSGEAAPSTSLLSGGIIPPMQAFWVKALKSDNLILDSKLTRSHQSSNALKAPAAKSSDRQRIRLQVDNGTTTDEALIYFDKAASDALDRYDSPKFAETNSVTQIFTTIGADKLVINGMNTINLETPIGLGFVPGSGTSFSIKANEISNLPADVKVILKDNVTLAETDLTDGVSTYSFSPEITSADRFSVIFRTSGATTGLNNYTDNSILTYYNNNHGLTIKTNNDKLIGSMVSVYNALGQQLISTKLSGVTMNIDFPYAPNVYFVRVDNVLKKVTIK
jgi:hypothetical protein